VPKVDDRRPPPELVAVIDAVHDEPCLEHERVRNYRIMLRVGILRDVEVEILTIWVYATAIFG
jgi:hypothetical protein